MTRLIASLHPDDEIEAVALVDYETAVNLVTHDEDKKILKYVFNR